MIFSAYHCQFDLIDNYSCILILFNYIVLYSTNFCKTKFNFFFLVRNYNGLAIANLNFWSKSLLRDRINLWDEMLQVKTKCFVNGLDFPTFLKGKVVWWVIVMVGDCPGGNCPCDYSPGGVVTIVQESRHGGGWGWGCGWGWGLSSRNTDYEAR